MKPPLFEYVRPANLGEALQALGRYGDKARILAGGQSLIPMMNLRLVHPQVLIDINRIAGLDQIRVDKGELVIGALARHESIARSEIVAKSCPLMAEAYGHVAHRPIRNRGTLAGNVSHADPASEMPAVLIALDATIVAKSEKNERNVAARGFFLGPLQTALKTGEMVSEIRIPVAPGGQGWAFEEESPRKGDFAMAAIACTLSMQGGKCSEAAIAVAGMGDRALLLAEAGAALKGKAVDGKAIAAAAAIAKKSVEPGASYHADAEFKRELVEALTERALGRALERCK